MKEKLTKEKSFIEKLSSWFKESCPFYAKVKDLNEGDLDAPKKPAVEVGLKITF